MTTATEDSWAAAITRYESVDAPVAAFNIELLGTLRPRWGNAVQVVTSMFRLWFVRPGNTYPFDEWVSVEWENATRVRAQLNRSVPRRSLAQGGGDAVVTGDFTKPENAERMVEALLLQMSGVEASG